MHFMHDLKILSDQVIHQHMLETSQKERELTLIMISLIEEASRRKFYLDLGFATLYDYLTLGLKYSSGAAMRRISCARLAKEIPEIKTQILDGTLTLSNVSQVEQYIRNEAKHDHVMSTEEKKEVLKIVAGKSVRQAESTLGQLSSAPEHHLKDKVKTVNSTLVQVTFSATPEFMNQLEECQGLLGHRMPGATIGEILAEMMKFGIAGLRKQKFKVKETEHEGQEPLVFEQKGKQEAGSVTEDNFISGVGNNSADYIPAAVKRAVSQRDRGRCVVVNPLTGKVCGSQAKVEFDHYPIPKAMGGPSTVDNLRLACSKCNLLHAVHFYGREKIVTMMKSGGE